MPLKVVNVKDIDRSEWLDYRRTGIGGSDAATVLNLNPYCSRMELYADKLGLMPEQEDNEAMRTGRDLEQYVAERFCEATGKKVRRNNIMWRSEEHPFMLADIDREIIGENAGLECKTTSAWNKTDFAKGEIPLTYYVQCMHYITVMGYDRMYLAVLILGKGFHWFTVERNEEEINALIAAEKDFYELIKSRREPDADGSQSASEAIERISGNSDVSKPSVPLYEVEDTLRQIERLTAEMKSLEKDLEQNKQTVKLVLKDATAGATDKYKVTWNTQVKTSVDSKLLQEKYPEIYRECSKQTESRVFRFSTIKQKETE